MEMGKRKKLNGEKRSILVVDDDEVTRDIMKSYLQKLYKVTSVSSGALAMEYLSKQSVDLVLLDYMMPDMDGPSVFRQIRSEFPLLHVPIIFLTGVSDKDLVIRGLSLHPKDYLLKPVSRTALLERVGKVMRKL